MSETRDQTLAHPVVTIDLSGEQLLINGNAVPVEPGTDRRTFATNEVARLFAQPLARPVNAIAYEAGRKTYLVIHLDGSISDVREEALEGEGPAATAPTPAPAEPAPQAQTPQSQAPQTEVAQTQAHSTNPGSSRSPSGWPTVPTNAPTPVPVPAQEPAPPTAAPAAEAAGVRPVSDPERDGGDRASRPSFITAGRTIQPAQAGWRGSLNRAGFKFSPGTAERAYRDDVAAVSRHWTGTRTVSVVNAKGSASKTPTVACLAAVFARFGGAGVLAWDNNETEGTLGFRTEWSPHRATMLNLLQNVDRLMGPSAAAAEMSNFVHHQPADKYDVLWSDTTIDSDHVVSAEDVEAIHRVASRYYRMTIMDSGNNSRAENWRTMIEHTDALVVPCTNVEDTAEVGARLLETLAKRGGRSEQLARNALVVVSQRTKEGKNMDRIVRDFAGLARDVVSVPYDPALETGVIRYDDLRDDTRRAWLAAAAAVTRTL